MFIVMVMIGLANPHVLPLNSYPTLAECRSGYGEDVSSFAAKAAFSVQGEGCLTLAQAQALASQWPSGGLKDQ